MSKKNDKKLKKITKELEWLIDRNVQWCIIMDVNQLII